MVHVLLLGYRRGLGRARWTLQVQPHCYLTVATTRYYSSIIIIIIIKTTEIVQQKVYTSPSNGLPANQTSRGLRFPLFLKYSLDNLVSSPICMHEAGNMYTVHCHSGTHRQIWVRHKKISPGYGIINPRSRV